MASNNEYEQREFWIASDDTNVNLTYDNLEGFSADVRRVNITEIDLNYVSDYTYQINKNK